MKITGYLMGVFVAAFALLACAQNTPQAQLAPVRVMVTFKPAVQFQNDDLLQALQAQTQAKVDYVTSVSNQTHVYRFTPSTGQTYGQLMEKISAMPTVARVEPDEKAQLH